MQNIGKTDQIVINNNDFIAPSFLRRFLCLFIDLVILFIILSIFYTIVVVITFRIEPIFSFWIVDIYQSLCSFAAAAVLVGYFYHFNAAGGKTPGKMIGHIKVVKLDGEPVDPNSAFYRAMNLIGPFALWLSSDWLCTLFRNEIAIRTRQFLILIASLYAIALIISVLFDNSGKKSIHDRLAKTRVIMEK